MWRHPESHPGAFLRARFLEPLGLTGAALASACNMPRSRVSDLLAGKRGISADTAHRLAAFFRMEPEQWMALQAEWDLSRAAQDPSIVPLDPVGFLVGPLGATRLPTRRPTRPTLTGPDRMLAADSPGAGYQPVTHAEVCYPDGTRALVAEQVE